MEQDNVQTSNVEEAKDTTKNTKDEGVKETDKKVEEKKYTDKELNDISLKNEQKALANKMNKTLSKYTNKKSKWSKNISIVNNENAGKLWSCDIRISNNTLEQEILHELLHARSISYYDEDVFIKYMYEEESAVEMFNKQILLKEKIPYYDNAYSNMVECLEEISDIIGEDKYEFAKKLFNVKVSEREKWLRNLFKNNSNKEKLEDLLREAFVKW